MRKQIMYVLTTVLFSLGIVFSSQANFITYDGGDKVVIVILDKMGNETSYDFIVPENFLGENGKLSSKANITVVGSTTETFEVTNDHYVFTTKEMDAKGITIFLTIGNYRVSN